MRRDAYRRQVEKRYAPMNGVRGCGGKRQYHTHLEAQRVAERLRRNEHCAARPYRCRHCHEWHVGDPMA